MHINKIFLEIYSHTLQKAFYSSRNICLKI